MKSILLFIAALSLTACGVETASTAASSAALKKKEIEQAQETQRQIQQQTAEALQQAQKRSEQADEAKHQQQSGNSANFTKSHDRLLRARPEAQAGGVMSSTRFAPSGYRAGKAGPGSRGGAFKTHQNTCLSRQVRRSSILS